MSARLQRILLHTLAMVLFAVTLFAQSPPKRDGEDVKYYINKGSVAEGMGDLVAAVEWFEIALVASKDEAQKDELKHDIADLKTRIVRSNEYGAHLEDGKALRKAGEHALAIKKFIEAIEAGKKLDIDTTEARKLWNETEYDLSILQGKAFMRAKHWKAALAKFKNAKKLMPLRKDAERDKLIIEAESKAE